MDSLGDCVLNQQSNEIHEDVVLDPNPHPHVIDNDPMDVVENPPPLNEDVENPNVHPHVIDVDAIANPDIDIEEVDAIAIGNPNGNPNPHNLNLSVLIPLMVQEIQKRRRKAKAEEESGRKKKGKAKEESAGEAVPVNDPELSNLIAKQGKKESQKRRKAKAKGKESVRKKKKTVIHGEEAVALAVTGLTEKNLKQTQEFALIQKNLPTLKNISPCVILTILRKLVRRTVAIPFEASVPLQPVISSQDSDIQHPYPWRELSIEQLANEQLANMGSESIKGEVECLNCGVISVATLDWREGFVKSASYIISNFIFSGDKMYFHWKPPLNVHIVCESCEELRAVPLISSSKETNWLFLFFTNMIGHVAESILERYMRSKCIQHLSDFPSKKELMFKFYLSMLDQLDPGGGWSIMLQNYGVDKPPDAYNKDASPIKLDLGVGVGVYLTEEGKPLVLNVVRQAEQLLVNDQTEYIPITGLADFNKLSAKLIFGADSPAIQENRITTVQCWSGTESLRVGAEFLTRHYHKHTIYIPRPTWGNHPKIFSIAGMSVEYYRYYDPSTRGLDFQGLHEDLNAAPAGAVVLLHACAHNPSGVDPTLEQWEKIRQLMRSKALLPFFDNAYQGCASGSLDADAHSVRIFVADGGFCIASQSYTKNMGLYGERVGALNIVCQTTDEARTVESQLELVIRPMYSSPPIRCASIVTTILKNRDMYNEWTIQLKGMADRIISIRQQLFDALCTRGTPGDWNHIIKQIGLFTFMGLNTQQVDFMTKEFHIYMTSDGRISMAGLNSKTVPRLADAIHAAVTKSTNRK